MSKRLIFIASMVLVLSSCTSSPVDPRTPAGTGDIDSSTTEKFESYTLPITRNGVKTTRVAYNFWSGEWPQPVIDVNSSKSGQTTIQAYTTLRDPKESDRVSCTIKNGIYHPWSKKDPSIIIYYSLSSREEYLAKEDTLIPSYNIRVPKDSVISNIIYYGENQCGAILRTGKKARSFSVSCDYFAEDKALVLTTPNVDKGYSEQWLYLQCAEKDTAGNPLKAFVKDDAILAQPGIKNGCPGEYGSVQGANNCGN